MTSTLWTSIGLTLATVWLLLLTVSVMLCIRQLGALTARMEIVALGSGVGHGAALGFRISDDLARAHPGLGVGRRIVLVVSATCASCTELLQELERGHQPEAIGQVDGVTALLVGPGDASRDEARRRISRVTSDVVLDPLATAVAQALRMKTLPAALYLVDGVVAGNLMFVDRLDQLDDLVSDADLGDRDYSALLSKSQDELETQLVG